MNIELKGKKLLMKRLLVSDVSQKYVDWLNDPEINQFLAIRGVTQNIDMVRAYVSSYERTDNKLLLGIFDIKTKIHIGNITFSSIDWKNEVGIIGIAIGDKNYRGQGYAYEALSLAVEFAFSELSLHRIDAWVSADNISSQKLFKRVGFNQEGILKDRVKYQDRFVDAYIFGIVNGFISIK